ncbi:MAG: GTPase HflX [Bacteroidota bacterium]|nr:GTPase HflX [Bacteroidota bacterium]
MAKKKRSAERAILISIITQQQSEEKVNEYLDELAFLAKTAGATALKRFTQKINKPDIRNYVGKGKFEEIIEFVKKHSIETAIFDDDLSPSQIRNLEKGLKCKVLDRTDLILDIFASRAQTAHAKAQVELAQAQYMLPRLKGMWTHLERQQGGIGTRGPGEKEIETDRRIIRNNITKLKAELKKIEKQKHSQRKGRGKKVRVALVGYTNAGKSTLTNLLSKSDIFAEDKLFATLDTTVRKVVIGNLPFLVSDTVGFIRKLPHHLVESFKSTLDELREADLLLHVADITHPNVEEHIDVVNETLTNLGVTDTKRILVFNKTDNYSYTPKDADDLSPKSRKNYSLDDLKKLHFAQEKDTVFISALKDLNIDMLKELLYREVKEIHTSRYPYDDFLY